ncbi:hypothetical protein, partial [Pseudomonas savastanoi]|uniref:hypothetical protein n=1 Tax=Pseudomonas savastanoi TaxID=29438 RepID=UPI001C7EE2E6
GGWLAGGAPVGEFSRVVSVCMCDSTFFKFVRALLPTVSFRAVSRKRRLKGSKTKVEAGGAAASRF